MDLVGTFTPLKHGTVQGIIDAIHIYAAHRTYLTRVPHNPIPN